jgi:hypothetical protein
MDEPIDSDVAFIAVREKRRNETFTLETEKEKTTDPCIKNEVTKRQVN